jgi:hypothetical protein
MVLGGTTTPLEVRMRRTTNPVLHLKIRERHRLFEAEMEIADVFSAAQRLVHVNTPTQIRDELVQAVREAEAGFLPGPLSPDAELYLGTTLGGFGDTPQEIRRVIELLKKAIDTACADVTSQMMDKGGRRADRRYRYIVNVLAEIWVKYTRTEPTHVIDPDNGKPVSPFNQFVEACFTKHWPEGEPIKRATLREAMRETLILERL